MMNMGWVAIWSVVASSVAFSDAFVVSPQTRWLPAAPTSTRQGLRHRSPAPVRTRFITTARRATETENEEDEIATPAPADDVFYPGQIGSRPKMKSGTDTDVDKMTDYPINLPSYLLLCLSTVVSIAFTGSIFEVTGGHPQLGYMPTYIIGTLSLPTFIFLFYAAIKKGQAEVEEDDAKYDGPW